MPELPSSHGSLDAEGGADGAEVGQPDVDEATPGAGEDGLDEFREWMRSRARQRKSEAERTRRGQRRAGRDPESEDDQSSSA